MLQSRPTDKKFAGLLYLSFTPTPCLRTVDNQSVARALDAQTGRVIWVDGDRKCGALFIALLKKLDWVYTSKSVIHLILENYVIHTSKITQRAVEQFGGRIVLHLLPPYCPDDNKIERGVWRNLHVDVTRNHKYQTMNELMGDVRYYLAKVNKEAAAKRPRIPS